MRFYPLRRNHSFGVCTLARLGTTIRLSLGRAPSEIPPPNSGPAFLLPAVGSWAVWGGRMQVFGPDDFGEFPKGELRRIVLLRTPLNRARGRPQLLRPGPQTCRLHNSSRRSLRRAHPLLVPCCIEVV